MGDDAWLTAAGAQVSRYWEEYRRVLVANARDFVLMGEDANGQPAKTGDIVTGVRVQFRLFGGSTGDVGYSRHALVM